MSDVLAKGIKRTPSVRSSGSSMLDRVKDVYTASDEYFHNDSHTESRFQSEDGACILRPAVMISETT